MTEQDAISRIEFAFSDNNGQKQTLLDKARAVPVVDNRRRCDFSHEHYELAIALLEGRIKPTQFSAAIGDKRASAVHKAWKMLEDGVQRGAIMMTLDKKYLDR